VGLSEGKPQTRATIMMVTMNATVSASAAAELLSGHGAATRRRAVPAGAGSESDSGSPGRPSPPSVQGPGLPLSARPPAGLVTVVPGHSPGLGLGTRALYSPPPHGPATAL
jgi:hypothetical protein